MIQGLGPFGVSGFGVEGLGVSGFQVKGAYGDLNKENRVLGHILQKGYQAVTRGPSW